MANPTANAKKLGSPIRRWAPVAILLVIALLLSFTLAWFVQSLNARNNTVTSVGVEDMTLRLYKQELKSDGTYANPTDANGVFKDKDADVTELSNFEMTPPQPDDDAGHPVVFVNNTAADFRPLMQGVNENGEAEAALNLGYDTIRKRLIVESNVKESVQFMMAFNLGKGDGNTADYFDSANGFADRAEFLPEAVCVNVYAVKWDDTAKEWKNEAAPIASFRNIGAEELQKLTINGELEASPDGTPTQTVYEFVFQIAPGASALYAGGKFQLDLSLEGFGAVGPTYFIKTPEDVKRVFGTYKTTFYSDEAMTTVVADQASATHFKTTWVQGELKENGSTIIMQGDIRYDADIFCPYLINFHTNGFDFLSTGTFELDTGAAQTTWGTVDFAATNSRVSTSGEAVNVGVAAARSSAVVFSGTFQKRSGPIDDLNTADGSGTGVKLNAPYAAVRWVAENNEAAGDDNLSGGTVAAPAPQSSTQPKIIAVRRFNGTDGKDLPSP